MYRISESSRKKRFLEAAVFFQDKVYTKVTDLEAEMQVFGADLYYTLFFYKCKD